MDSADGTDEAAETFATEQDRVRGFPAFAPRRSGGGRARSWWGREWIAAMEDTSLDRDQLRRGRRYAQSGHVGTITLSPGRIAAPVQGEDGTPYRTTVRLEPLTEPEWDRFLGQVARTSGHIAALLDRDMPPDLVAAAADAGVRLLPDIGDLDPDCDCPGWELPCRHAAALCYQAAWLLDDDPFLLLLLRGRGQRELLAELRRRNAGPERAEAADGPAETALEWLTGNARLRARELLAAEDPVTADEPYRQPWPDAARIAATRPGDAVLHRLRTGTGRAPELAVAARAWEHGAAVGLSTLEHSWQPPELELARGRARLADVGAPEPGTEDNRLTLAAAQVRLGTDHRWYPYRWREGRWWPSGPPATDAGTALGELPGG